MLRNENGTAAQTGANSGRKPYQSPELVVLGGIDAMVQAGASNGPDGNGIDHTAS